VAVQQKQAKQRAQQTASPLRVRKDADDLSADELSAYSDAVAAMQSRSDDRGYAFIASIASRMSQNRNRLFLPWNRALLHTFEQLAAEVTTSGVAIPYWEWTRHPGLPAAFATGSLASGPIWYRDGDADTAGSTTREPGPGDRLPGDSQIEGILYLGDFEAFSEALEVLSDQVHVWVGGAMANIKASPYDPLFWSHRAMVDRIWWVWQELHDDDMPYEGEDQLPPDLWEQPLEPFRLTVGAVVDIDELGYEYATAELGLPPRFATGAVSDRTGKKLELGFGHYAAAFAELIASPETKTPLTIGIFGSWGAGKSTLLQAIVEKIRSEQGKVPPERRDEPPRADESPYVHVVNFNAWDYNANELIWPALARQTMAQIQKELPFSRWQRFKLTFTRNLRREWARNSGRIVAGAILLLVTALFAALALDLKPETILLAIGALGLGGVLKLASDTVNSPVSRWVGSLFQGENYGQRPSDLEAIRDDLDWLEHRLQDTARRHRVLIVIDDLDRCEPDKAVEVLQAVNRLLDRDSFIVCLGVDARIVTAAIQSHYANVLEAAGASGYEYLDKIVQIPFRIPDPDRDAIKGFLASQLPTDVIEHDTEGAPVAEAGTPTAGVPDTAPDGAPPDETPDDEMYTAPAAPEQQRSLGQRVSFTQDEQSAFSELADYLRPNPRHVKRLVNVYRLVRTLADRQRSGDDEAAIVTANPRATIRWLAISAQWPYTARAILESSRMLERTDALPVAPVLPALLEHAGGWISRDTQGRFDEDVHRLEALVAETYMTWEELTAIRSYTINFNPAVEEQLRLERTRPPVGAKEDARVAGAEPAPPV
jgi:hypothetical protein